MRRRRHRSEYRVLLQRKAVDVRQVGRELNVRYVLEGSVQRGGDRLRVNVQLIDTESGMIFGLMLELLADILDMQDEIVARLANALNAQLAAAEARRAEQAPNPDSMDLYFQGRAWINKGQIPDNVARARKFFDRALIADFGNVDALIELARADVVEGTDLIVTNPTSALAEAELKLTKALASVPDHPRAHMYLGLVEICTKRGTEGIAKCEHALALDRNLAHAHNLIGLGKTFIGRAEETEAHVAEALRLSPRDTLAYLGTECGGCGEAPPRQLRASGCVASTVGRGQPKLSPSVFHLAAALAQLDRLDEAQAAVKAGLALNPTFTISRVRASRTARTDDPTCLAQLECIFEGLRKAGVPEQ